MTFATGLLIGVLLGSMFGASLAALIVGALVTSKRAEEAAGDHQQ